MFPAVVTKDPTAVEVEVQAAYLAIFPRGDKLFVPQIFGWAIDCFTGQYEDYQPIDAKYHDFEHTLQGMLCMARMLRARHATGAAPVLTQEMLQLGFIAILLHDTGYLKRAGDTDGTGAKYTAIHVGRSAEFAAELLRKKHFKPQDIKSVQNMINCTGINARLDLIPFQSELERIVGFGLGTADLLGQMAADDYVDKLPILYSEFAEAARFMPEKAQILGKFTSEFDLMTKTPDFWDKYVVPKLDRDFAGVFRFLAQPYPSGPNWYMDKIEANIDRLRRDLAEAATAAR